MRSPILGMTDQELAWMMALYKRHAKKDQDRGIYGAWQFWLRERPWEANPEFEEIGRKLQKLSGHRIIKAGFGFRVLHIIF